MSDTFHKLIKLSFKNVSHNRALASPDRLSQWFSLKNLIRFFFVPDRHPHRSQFPGFKKGPKEFRTKIKSWSLKLAYESDLLCFILDHLLLVRYKLTHQYLFPLVHGTNLCFDATKNVRLSRVTVYCMFIRIGLYLFVTGIFIFCHLHS